MEIEVLLKFPYSDSMEYDKVYVILSFTLVVI